MKKTLNPFHLAFPIYDIQDTIEWYTNILGCKIGRQSNKWVDFDFFGHQISAHLTSKKKLSLPTNKVDEKNIPIGHFGIIMSIEKWKDLSNRLINKKQKFIVKPYIRFQGSKGEQATMFIKDPSGNVLEFKAFKKHSMIFEN